MQTNQWRSMDAISGTAHYHREAIDHGMEFLAGDEANWESFFIRNDISPYRLTYEELTATPEDAIRRLLLYLGYDDTPQPSLPSTKHRRQADAITEEWVRHYLEEKAAPQS